MMRTLALLPPAILGMPESTPPIPGPWGYLLQYGAVGAMLIFIAFMWDRDTKARRIAQEASDTRYGTLVEKFLEVIQANTAAQVRLFDALQSRPCLIDEKGLSRR